ncbi:TPA: hypothetical protein DCZ15_00665 [Candidatus Falkowbacteria bacterium]|nr:MAG: hypothetical protein UV95_C0004G0055 [Candidatus Falkowbacteria bacterium GW2011_GWF2_43_32]HBA36366.1 hypothetical protein [Candidatus Falkowbacteria bacterium]
MPDHQNKLIAETSSELSAVLKLLRRHRADIKNSYKEKRGERQILSREERRVILNKTARRCHICGGKIEGNKFDADHVMAHSSGGKHNIDNYLPAHSLCNNYRWDYLAEEFQLILKIGVWCRTLIEHNKTTLDQKIAKSFIEYEKSRLKRRKK